MNEEYIVYGLEDPRDHLYHYIGFTNDVYTRFRQHITGDGGNIEKNVWIFECRQANLMVLMREIERTKIQTEAEQREQFWIGYYLHLGHPLHNRQVTKTILKEKARLEEQYKQLLEEKIRLEELAHNLEEENHSLRTINYKMRKQPSTNYIPDEHKELQVAAFYRQGHTIHEIMQLTGLTYYRVQKITSESIAINQ